MNFKLEIKFFSNIIKKNTDKSLKLSHLTRINKYNGSFIENPFNNEIIPQLEYQIKTIENKQNFIKFIYNSGLNLSIKNKGLGNSLFKNSIVTLEHTLNDNNINLFRDGIRSNNYNLYEKYLNVPEIIFLGLKNSGKSTIINSLFEKDICKVAKSIGTTQQLEFFLIKKQKGRLNSSSIIQKKKNIFNDFKFNNYVFLIDSPMMDSYVIKRYEGDKYNKIPRILNQKFNYLIDTYLHHAVRLKLIFYVINSKYGMTSDDWIKLVHLNDLNIHICVVFSFCDNYTSNNFIPFIKEISNRTMALKNVRSEILLVSSNTGYGIENMRAYIWHEIFKFNINKMKESNELVK